VRYGIVAHVARGPTTNHLYQHELTISDTFSWAVINVDMIQINLSLLGERAKKYTFKSK